MLQNPGLLTRAPPVSQLLHTQHERVWDTVLATAGIGQTRLHRRQVPKALLLGDAPGGRGGPADAFCRRWSREEEEDCEEAERA